MPSMESPFASLLERAIAYRVAAAEAAGLTGSRVSVTGYLYGTPLNNGNGWHLVAVVHDASLDRPRLRV